MLSNILDSEENRIMRLADLVAYRRPYANREFDQIFMLAADMVKQVDVIEDYIRAKNVLFLGDGDGMSMMFGLFGSQGIIEGPSSMTIYDFDQRIIHNIKTFAEDYKFLDKYKLKCYNYNVIDPIPQQSQKRYNFFYINPPYGSKNHGLSTEAWLHRCIDMCTENCSGCIVIPYDNQHRWTQDAMLDIQKFLAAHGFVVRDMISSMHLYHLKDNPELKSATVIVDKIASAQSEYSGKQLPISMLVNMYGSPRSIPHYIIDDGSPMGRMDFDWKFGHNFWEG